MEIKILGTGCPKCQRLEQVTREAAAAAGIEIEVVKVKDINDIMAYDLVATPGLVINGVVKASGHIPQKDEIVAWLQAAR
jgi:small redox-active disulfide protein 2